MFRNNKVIDKYEWIYCGKVRLYDLGRNFTQNATGNVQNISYYTMYVDKYTHLILYSNFTLLTGYNLMTP